MGPTENLWDARDVARYLKASRSWVYQRAEAGLLPCFRIGGLLRFEPAAVRTWAASGTTPPTPALLPTTAPGDARGLTE